jgi:hypothetical protein
MSWGIKWKDDEVKNGIRTGEWRYAIETLRDMGVPATPIEIYKFSKYDFGSKMDAIMRDAKDKGLVELTGIKKYYKEYKSTQPEYRLTKAGEYLLCNRIRFVNLFRRKDSISRSGIKNLFAATWMTPLPDTYSMEPNMHEISPVSFGDAIMSLVRSSDIVGGVTSNGRVDRKYTGNMNPEFIPVRIVRDTSAGPVWWTYYVNPEKLTKLVGLRTALGFSVGIFHWPLVFAGETLSRNKLRQLGYVFEHYGMETLLMILKGESGAVEGEAEEFAEKYHGYLRHLNSSLPLTHPALADTYTEEKAYFVHV